MIWTALSVIVCLALLVKLLFFTDQERCQAGVTYRVIVYLLAVYAFSQVVTFLYAPERVSPITTLLHLGMFVAAVMLKPKHFPWNSRCQHED